MKKVALILLLSSCWAWGRTPDDSLPAGVSLVPSNNVWMTDITNASVSANNATWIDVINGHAGHNFHANFGTQLVCGSTTTWNGIPYNIVWSTSTARKPVNLGTYAAESDTPPDGGVPIPDDAIIEQDEVGGTATCDNTADRHLLIVDASSGTLYEMFAASRTATGGWGAAQLSIWASSSNAMRPDGWTSSDASGMTLTPGLLRYEEVSPVCKINHAIRFEISLVYSHYWPASHSANTGGTLNPPLGMRVRMKSGVDVTGGGSVSAIGQCIFNALKKYGAILADTGGDWYIDGAPDLRWDDTTLHNDFISIGLPLNTMEVVDESTWMVAANSYQAQAPAGPPPGQRWNGRTNFKGTTRLQ